MLTSVVSVFFYLRVVVMMYMADGTRSEPMPRVAGLGMAGLTVAIVAIFWLGLLPTQVLDFAQASIATIF
jgi:NADH-quinone oxidoreductase subunit N